MAPGFEYEDYETGQRQELSAQLPAVFHDDSCIDTLGC